MYHRVDIMYKLVTEYCKRKSYSEQYSRNNWKEVKQGNPKQKNHYNVHTLILKINETHFRNSVLHTWF